MHPLDQNCEVNIATLRGKGMENPQPPMHCQHHQLMPMNESLTYQVPDVCTC